jgi:hypothetical protein
MSKAIYIVHRNIPEDKVNDEHFRLETICRELIPDNIEGRRSIIFIQDGIAYAVSNPQEVNLMVGKSLLLGHISEEYRDRWAIPEGGIPDGSFVLFRGDNDLVEILTDRVASRTAWYYFDENILMASTSQLAMVRYLGNFSFNPNTIPWLLSSGTLGPVNSWDKRFYALKSGACLKLNRKTWTMTIERNEYVFSFSGKTSSDQIDELSMKIKDAFKDLKFDFDKWVLPLSGGYDSRSILYLLSLQKKDIADLRSVTWGMSDALANPVSDASIAIQLANYFGIKHKYFRTDVIEADEIDVVVKRFIQCGEGRIDHIAAYMDGFAIWKELFENDVAGIIRGDEGFGWVSTESEFAVRRSCGLLLCKDFWNLNKYLGSDLPKQEIPGDLERKVDETLALWRDRLYHEYRIPVTLAALSDLKLSYVEIANPLLHASIIDQVLKCDDELRTNKSAFKAIVNSFNIDVSYAKGTAIGRLENILRQAKVKRYLLDSLTEYQDGNLIPHELMHSVIRDLHRADSANSIYNRIKSLIRRSISNEIKRKAMARNPYISIPDIVLAFRILIIHRIHELFSRSV